LWRRRGVEQEARLNWVIYPGRARSAVDPRSSACPPMPRSIREVVDESARSGPPVSVAGARHGLGDERVADNLAPPANESPDKRHAPATARWSPLTSIRKRRAEGANERLPRGALLSAPHCPRAARKETLLGRDPRLEPKQRFSFFNFLFLFLICFSFLFEFKIQI
jgi:hypothetical protein